MNESFKVITEDKSSEPYLRELSNILTKLRIIGVSYNEAVKSINRYHSAKTAQRLLQMLEGYSLQIISLQQQAITLTIDYNKR